MYICAGYVRALLRRFKSTTMVSIRRGILGVVLCMFVSLSYADPSVDTSGLRLHTGGVVSITLTSSFSNTMNLRPGTSHKSS